MPDPFLTFQPIGTIHSCYGEKFGIPRQPGLVTCASATLELIAPYDTRDALRGLEVFSHVWILFVFHQSMPDSWKATVRPPRLGGNKRVGVFASRSNFRPNPIGLSVVELVKVNGTCLTLGGGDFLDGTPVLDIKPYIPYADSLPAATGGYAADTPVRVNEVEFTPTAEETISILGNDQRPTLRQLIRDMLGYNPRPAYQGDDPDRLFGTRIYDLEVRWKQTGSTIHVVSVEQV